MASVQEFFEGCEDLESLSGKAEMLRTTGSQEEVDDVDWEEIEAYRGLAKEKMRLDKLIELDMAQAKLKEIDVKTMGLQKLKETITALVACSEAVKEYEQVVWELNEASQSYVNKLVESALSLKLPKLTPEQMRQV